MRRFVCLMAAILLSPPAWGAEARAAASAKGSLSAAEIALTEGIVAFNHGEDEEAVAKLRESLESVDQGVTRYWLGLALLRLGRTQEAVRELRASLAGPQPVQEELRPAVLAALDAAAKGSREVKPTEAAGFPRADRRPSWDGALTLSSGYDSNPNLLAEGLRLPPGPGEKPVSGKDADTVASLGLRGAWHPRDLWGGWSAQVSAAAQQSAHSELDFLDFSEVLAAAHLVRGADPSGYLFGPLGSARAPFVGSRRVVILLQAGGSYSELGGDSFFRSWEAAGSLTIRAPVSLAAQPGSEHAQKLPSLKATRLSLHVQDRSFFHDEHRARSGEQVTVEISEIVRLLDSGVEVRLSVLAGDRNASEMFSESFLDAGGEVLLPVSRRWSLRLSGGWRRDDFDHPLSNLFQPGIGKPRQDETLRAAAALTWEVGERLRATARASYTRRDSNVAFEPSFPDLDYRRATAALGLSWLF